MSEEVGARTMARSRRWWIGGIVVGAFVLRLVAVVTGPGLGGDLGYDDAVYFSAAAALVHGVVPYRDFVLLETPGILVALAPFAVVARVLGDEPALALARVSVMLLGSLNVGLAARLGWRWSRGAGIATGVLAAAWPLLVTFDRTTMLQTPQATCLLAALLVLAPMATDARALTSRRLLAAGGLLGMATGIQLWNAAPLVVLAGLVAWWSWRDRARLGDAAKRAKRAKAAKAAAMLLAGAGVALAALLLPFALLAADPMIRMALIDQLGRPDLGVDVVTRLRVLEGGPTSLAGAGPWSPGLVVMLAAAIGVAALSIARLVPPARAWVAVFGTQAAVILVTPVFFDHYAAWPAIVAVPTFGVGVAEAVQRVRSWRRGPFAPRGRRAGLAGAAGPAGLAARAIAVVGVAAFLVGIVAADLRATGARQPRLALERAVIGSRCVATNRPVLLLMTNTLQRNLDAGCPVVVDPTGLALDVDHGHLLPGLERNARLGEPGYQAAMAAYFGNADAVLLSRRARSDLTPATQEAIAEHLPRRVRLGSVVVLLPRS